RDGTGAVGHDRRTDPVLAEQVDELAQRHVAAHGDDGVALAAEDLGDAHGPTVAPGVTQVTDAVASASMGAMRLFVAIRPPAAVLDHVDAATADVRAAVGGGGPPALRWT